MQEQVEAIAPQGWTLSLDGFSLGNVAPTLSGWQVYNDTVTGEVESLTTDLVLESTSLSVSLTGSGPLVGKFVGAPARHCAVCGLPVSRVSNGITQGSTPAVHWPRGKRRALSVS